MSGCSSGAGRSCSTKSQMPYGAASRNERSAVSLGSVDTG
jgi:hypothetical protein